MLSKEIVLAIFRTVWVCHSVCRSCKPPVRRKSCHCLISWLSDSSIVSFKLQPRLSKNWPLDKNVNSWNCFSNFRKRCWHRILPFRVNEGENVENIGDDWECHQDGKHYNPHQAAHHHLKNTLILVLIKWLQIGPLFQFILHNICKSSSQGYKILNKNLMQICTLVFKFEFITFATYVDYTCLVFHIRRLLAQTSEDQNENKSHKPWSYKNLMFCKYCQAQVKVLNPL